MYSEGVVHRDKPLRVGGVPGEWWWQPKLPGRKWRDASPPSEKGVKMFDLAQRHLRPRGEKGGGASQWRFIAIL